MGNLLESAWRHKGEIFAGLSLIGLFVHALREGREKTRLLRLLEELARHNGAPASRNEVYLKEEGVQQSISRSQWDAPIYKIAITGGPCAGKSTSLTRISADLEKSGFRVFKVPEIPTLVVHAGGMILMAKFNVQERIRFQSLLIRFQIYTEDYFTKLAAMSKSPSIVLCDRGTVDPAAYVSHEQFQAIMDEEGWSLVTLRDRRYDRVIFLTSAAAGAEKFYTLENNIARSQGLQVARILDRKTLDAWTGHPHLTICPNVNGETFEMKINRAVSAVRTTVGLEKQKNFEEKYLISAIKFPPEFCFEVSEIEEIFLKKEDDHYVEDKIKRRGQHNSYTYQRKLRGKKDQEGNFRLQIRKPLTSLQYVMLREQRSDPKYRPIVRSRINFTYNSLSYSVDIYDPKLFLPEVLDEAQLPRDQPVHVLRFENEVEDPHSLIPNFVVFIKDVRRDKNFSLSYIASIDK